MAAILGAGCGGGSSGDDMGVNDMGVGGGDLAVNRPDMTMPLMLGGTRVVTGAAQYITVNNDNWLLYFATGGIKAVKTDGTGDRVVIPNGSWVSPWRKVVFGWQLNAATDTTGTLFAWKDGEANARQVATNSVRPSQDKTLSGAAASDDGTKILYAVANAANGTTAEIFLANYDGTGTPTSIQTNIPIDGACELTMGFTGGKFLVGYCTSQPIVDGGIATATVIAVDAATGTKATLFTGARNFFSVDTNATKVFGISATQVPMWVPITGGAPTIISATDTVRGELGLINPAGTNILWVTESKKLMRLDVSSSGQTPVTLTTGVEALLTIAPNYETVIVAKTVDSQTGNSDVHLVSATQANQVTTLVSTATGAIFGAGYTPDSSRVLYYTDVVDGAGTMHSKPVAGGADVVLAMDVWLEYPAANGKVLFTDRYHDGAQGGLVDLKYIDATGGTATLVSTNIDDDPQGGLPDLTRDGSKLIYTYSGRPASAQGIYVYSVP
jgi:hypothetical protein